MEKSIGSRQPQVTWVSLNKRQQDYLTAIYHADQEVEANERSSWSLGMQRRPASVWRWMTYATLDGIDTPVKRHLRSTKQISEGTGSTLEALERRELIEVRYDITTYNGRDIFSDRPIPTIQITKVGRALVRKALSLRSTKHIVGTLQEWHWRALAKAYEAREQGVQQEGIGYGRIGWNTWVRLRDYTIKGHEYPLIEERKGVSITSFGIAFYERCYSRYTNLYPTIAAPIPITPSDPLEPYVEELQDNRTCRACHGQHLVAIIRTYQQDRTWTWNVNEQEQRIVGLVTSRYANMKIQQCTCKEEDIQETAEFLVPLLDQLSTHGWQLSFPYHHWFSYLDYVVGGAVSGRELRWYDAQLVKEKVQPLLGTDESEEDEARNVTKAGMHYYWNERVGKGSIYPEVLGKESKQVLALTQKQEMEYKGV